MIPTSISPLFTRPFRPSSGIQEIILITLEVQNGIVHRRNSATCIGSERTQKDRNSATRNPTISVTSQVMKTNFRVET